MFEIRKRLYFFSLFMYFFSLFSVVFYDLLFCNGQIYLYIYNASK